MHGKNAQKYEKNFFLNGKHLQKKWKIVQNIACKP